MESENKHLDVYKAFLGDKPETKLSQLEDRGYSLKECAILASKLQKKRDDRSWWVGKRGDNDYIYVTVLGNVDAPKWYVDRQLIYPEIGPEPGKIPVSFHNNHYRPYFVQTTAFGCKECGDGWSYETNSSPVQHPEIVRKCWKCLGVY